MLKKWKLLDSKVEFESKFMTIKNNTYELPNGQTGESYYHLDRPDYVMIVAIDQENRIVLEKQYRRGCDEFNYEFPSGWIDPNEDPNVSAVREFKEETGFDGVGEVKNVLFAQPGFCSMKGYIAIVKFDSSKIGEKDLASDENIEFELIHVDEVKEMLKNGIIRDMNTAAAFGIFLVNNF